MVLKKSPTIVELFFGGRDRIRTGVDGVADHCLASRPPDHFL